MTTVEIGFWCAALVVAWPYLLYPLFLATYAWLRPRPLRPRDIAPRAVSIILPVHNEEQNIDRRLTELVRLLEGGPFEGEVIVVSDGSTDGTAVLARAHTKGPVRVIELPEKGGKAAALTCGAAEATHDILVFADARQQWAPDALEMLLEDFTDPDVGAVSGDLVVVAPPGTLTGVGLYWRMEKWLRQQESALWSQVGVTGAISAVRRELFHPIPPGTLLDDVYWPAQVALEGKRVVHESRALAYDRLPDRTFDEFRRKVRTLAGNFQLAARLPRLLLPWGNPIWAAFWSHKLLRLAVPWALLALLVLNVRVASQPLYAVLLGLQVGGYSLALAGLLTPLGRLSKLAASSASFLVLNVAAWVGFWSWALGLADRTWTKSSYAVPVEEPERLAG